MDAGLFIDPLAVCIDSAGGAAGPLRALAGAQTADKRLADLQLLGAQLGIALQEVFIVSRIKLLLSQVGQTVDLRKGIVQLPLHALHLLLKAQLFAQKLLGTVLCILPFYLQDGHSLLVGSELLGDGQQFFKDGLSPFAARSGDMDKILQNGSEIAAGLEQAAAHGKKYQQHQHGGDLRHAFQHDAVIGAFRDQHRQGMGRLVPVSHRTPSPRIRPKTAPSPFLPRTPAAATP